MSLKANVRNLAISFFNCIYWIITTCFFIIEIMIFGIILFSCLSIIQGTWNLFFPEIPAKSEFEHILKILGTIDTILLVIVLYIIFYSVYKLILYKPLVTQEGTTDLEETLDGLKHHYICHF